jgi:Tfp pilus assembly protein PilF
MLVSGAVVVVIAAGMFLMGFNLKDFLRHVTTGSVDFLPLFSVEGGNFPYPMFSVTHLWDWLNANLLIVPFGLAIAVILMATHGKELDWKKPQFIFLILASVCGLMFTWIINSALGLARDWDLLAAFFVPLMILDVYLLSRPLSMKSRHNLLAMIAGLTLIHFCAWIGVNASADRHLERMKLLDSPKFLSATSQIVHAEALANYFFDLGDYKNARIYYEAYLKIDDHNPRILGNVADTYRRVGEKEKYVAALQRAVAMNSRDPGVFLNLGVEYANRHDTALAIEFNEKAVAMDSTQRLAHANLGILYSAKGKYSLADRHFATAIELGMKDPSLFRYAGDVCSVLNEFDRAYQYYTSYLELVPSDSKVRAVRDRVRESLSNPPARQ